MECFSRCKKLRFSIFVTWKYMNNNISLKLKECLKYTINKKNVINSLLSPYISLKFNIEHDYMSKLPIYTIRAYFNVS